MDAVHLYGHGEIRTNALVLFTGHRDTATRNHTSAYYEVRDGVTYLTGGRFHEFAPEALDAELRDALSFSRDGTVPGIDWAAFRAQKDRYGLAYMDHARRETFLRSKLDWDTNDERQLCV